MGPLIERLKMAKGVFSFKNTELDRNKPSKLIKARVILVCPECHEPNKCFIQAVLNKGQAMMIQTRLAGTCDNSKCKARIEELVAVTLEYR